MMTSKIFRSIILMVVVSLTFSCKKSDSTTSGGLKLSKITFWNPSTGAETTSLELSYDAKGTLVSGKGSGGNVYSAIYNASGSVTKVTSVFADGRITTYELSYNAAGNVIKNVQTNTTAAGVSTISNTFLYEYNANGKLTKVNTTTGGGSTTTAEYSWSGENIAQYKYSNSSSATVYTYMYTYDNKISPFYGGGNVVEFVLYGNPICKNNATEIQISYGSTVTTQKRSYEYNAEGYATSMKLLDGSNEGNKYYYSK